MRTTHCVVGTSARNDAATTGRTPFEILLSSPVIREPAEMANSTHQRRLVFMGVRRYALPVQWTACANVAEPDTTGAKSVVI